MAGNTGVPRARPRSRPCNDPNVEAVAALPICPHLQRCSIRQAIGMKAALAVWHSFYCESGFLRCERYKLACAGSDVPARLLPNGRLLEGKEAAIAKTGS